MGRFTRQLQALFASPRFFWGVVIFFVLQALWLVFSAAYPLAFDERFHLESIKVYADNWPSPFLSEHPPGADMLGTVTREASYFFHYLMSFPYQLIALFTDSRTAQVIVLRLLNVAMFTGGLLLFARVLRRAGTSAALTNTALAIFVLVPIVPYLAAHINYDNLAFLLLPWLLLLAFDAVGQLKERRVDAATLFLFILGCIFIGLVKLAMLPLMVAVVAFLGFIAFRSFRGQAALIPSSLRKSYQQLSFPVKIGFLVAFVIAFGLFFQRYGVNIVTYGKFSPECDQVLTVEQCLEYGPWARNYHIAQQGTDFDANPVTYMGEWLWGMWHRSFFAVAGVENDFATRFGLPVPKLTGIALAVLGVIAVIVRFRDTFRRNPLLQMLALMSLFYCAVLWLKLYAGLYNDTGAPVAINGRYLIPVLLPIAAVMGRALSLWLQKAPAAKAYAAAGTILLFLYGGGVFTYIILSEQAWLWQNDIVLQVNEAVRNALSLVILR